MTIPVWLSDAHRGWAAQAELLVDSRGYLSDFAANLRPGVRAETLASFRRGSGGELKGKMRALHSSSALAVNFFDQWADPPRVRRLAEALGLRSSISRPAVFEAQFPTPLRGIPPNLDLALYLDDGSVAALECKYCEWLSAKRGKVKHFTEKYLSKGATYWDNAGLPRCQELATSIGSGSVVFKYLDATQLLKHALGLATQHPRAFRLLYVYWEHSVPQSDAHQREVSRFASIVGDDFPFGVITYQTLLERLCAGAAASDTAYFDYLRGRYMIDPSRTK